METSFSVMKQMVLKLLSSSHLGLSKQVFLHYLTQLGTFLIKLHPCCLTRVEGTHKNSGVAIMPRALLYFWARNKALKMRNLRKNTRIAYLSQVDSSGFQKVFFKKKKNQNLTPIFHGIQTIFWFRIFSQIVADLTFRENDAVVDF